ncbi:transposase [Dictyobacter formicarum]|uniref:transposase n=1 Tax=Dictyobacter formicarum TaxID=2778368 RepID=UPI0035709B6E
MKRTQSHSRRKGAHTDGYLDDQDNNRKKAIKWSWIHFIASSGTLGKIGNCQVIVSVEFLADDPASSPLFHWPVSAQLFLPEAWIQDTERRKQAQAPSR